MWNQVIRDPKKLAFALIVACATLGLLLIYSPLFIPLGLAGIFSLGIAEIFIRLQARFARKQVRWVFYGIAGVFVGFFLLLSVNSLSRIYNLTIGEEREKTLEISRVVMDKLNESIDQFTSNYSDEAGTFGLTNKEQIKRQIKDFGRTYVQRGLAGIGEFFASLPEASVSLFILAVALFILVTHRSRIFLTLLGTNLFSFPDLREITLVAREASYTVIISNLIVGTVQASIISFGALAAGLNEFSIIFLISFICSFLPVVGTAPAAFFLALFAFAIGETGGGIWMLLVTLIAGTIDNFLRPYLVTRSEKNLNSMVSLIGIIGAIMVFGFSGLFIGPFLIAFVFRIWPYAKGRLMLDDKVDEKPTSLKPRPHLQT